MQWLDILGVARFHFLAESKERRLKPLSCRYAKYGTAANSLAQYKDRRRRETASMVLFKGNKVNLAAPLRLTVYRNISCLFIPQTNRNVKMMFCSFTRGRTLTLLLCMIYKKPSLFLSSCLRTSSMRVIRSSSFIGWLKEEDRARPAAFLFPVFMLSYAMRLRVVASYLPYRRENGINLLI